MARSNARGHGAYGFLSGLRTFKDLDQLSVAARHTYCDLYAAQVLVGAWTSDGAGGWSLPKNDIFDGRPQDVVGVLVKVGDSVSMLSRTETQAAADATAGTWFYDNDGQAIIISGADNPAFGADVNLETDDGGDLIVHLPGDTDPNTVTVLALTIFGFWTGTKENPVLYVQPILGSELFADPSIESWFNPLGPSVWGVSELPAGWSVNQDSALIDDGGAYSARFESNGALAGLVDLFQSISLITSKSYRISGAYKTDAANPSTAKGYVKLPNGGVSPLLEDGRNVLAGDGVALRDTMGEVRRFFGDFVWPGGTGQTIQLINSAATACKMWVDGLSLKRIWGWRFYEPRLSADGIPELALSAPDVYPGSEEGGGGTLVLLNDQREAVTGITGYFEALLSRYITSGKRLIIRHGGQFPDDGQDIPWEDMQLGFTGVVRKPGTSDDVARFELDEVRKLLDTQLPLRKYNKLDAPNVREGAQERHRPYWIGYETNVSPERIDTEATTGLPIYELTDPALVAHATDAIYTVAGALEHVWAYEDYDAAGIKDPSSRVELANGTDYDRQGASNERVRLLRNPGPIRIEAGVNDRADFKANGVTYQAEIAPGLKTLHQLKSDLTTLFNLLTGGSPTTWAFTESSGGLPLQKYSVSYSGAGTLELLIGTGAAKERSIYSDIGFTGDSDLTGTTSYTADTAMPYDADTRPFIIRIDNYGLRDDASGTYTGVASGPLKLAPDILKLLLVKVLGLDAATQISASFVSARASCPQEQSVYLGGLTSVQGGASFGLTLAEIRERFSIGCQAQIVFDAGGVAYFVPITDTIPATAPHFRDYDFLDWWGELPSDHVYGYVRINYGQDPTLGSVLGREQAMSDTAFVYDRTQPRTWDTFLRYEFDAANSLSRIVALARQPIRHFAFSVVGRCAAVKIGDIVLLTRSRGLVTASGTSIDGQAFRVLVARKNPIDGSTAYVVATLVTA